MRRVAVLLGLIGLMCQLTACATIFKEKTKKEVSLVDFRSEPDGATVEINGEERGTTPTTVGLDPKKNHDVRIKKEGYETGVDSLDSNIGPVWIALDGAACLVTLCISVVVDAVTEAWWELERNTVYIKLEKTSSTLMRKLRERRRTKAALDTRQ